SSRSRSRDPRQKLPAVADATPRIRSSSHRPSALEPPQQAGQAGANRRAVSQTPRRPQPQQPQLQPQPPLSAESEPRPKRASSAGAAPRVAKPHPAVHVVSASDEELAAATLARPTGPAPETAEGPTVLLKVVGLSAQEAASTFAVQVHGVRAPVTAWQSEATPDATPATKPKAKAPAPAVGAPAKRAGLHSTPTAGHSGANSRGSVATAETESEAGWQTVACWPVPGKSGGRGDFLAAALPRNLVGLGWVFADGGPQNEPEGSEAACGALVCRLMHRHLSDWNKWSQLARKDPGSWLGQATAPAVLGLAVPERTQCQVEMTGPEGLDHLLVLHWTVEPASNKLVEAAGRSLWQYRWRWRGDVGRQVSGQPVDDSWTLGPCLACCWQADGCYRSQPLSGSWKSREAGLLELSVRYTIDGDATAAFAQLEGHLDQSSPSQPASAGRNALAVCRPSWSAWGVTTVPVALGLSPPRPPSEALAVSFPEFDPTRAEISWAPFQASSTSVQTLEYRVLLQEIIEAADGQRQVKPGWTEPEAVASWNLAAFLERPVVDLTRLSCCLTSLRPSHSYAVRVEARHCGSSGDGPGASCWSPGLECKVHSSEECAVEGELPRPEIFEVGDNVVIPRNSGGTSPEHSRENRWRQVLLPGFGTLETTETLELEGRPCGPGTEAVPWKQLELQPLPEEDNSKPPTSLLDLTALEGSKFDEVLLRWKAGDSGIKAMMTRLVPFFQVPTQPRVRLVATETTLALEVAFHASGKGHKAACRFQVRCEAEAEELQEVGSESMKLADLPAGWLEPFWRRSGELRAFAGQGDLVPSQVYKVRVRVGDLSGWSPWSAPSTPIEFAAAAPQPRQGAELSICPAGVELQAHALAYAAASTSSAELLWEPFLLQEGLEEVDYHVDVAPVIRPEEADELFVRGSVAHSSSNHPAISTEYGHHTRKSMLTSLGVCTARLRHLAPDTEYIFVVSASYSGLDQGLVKDAGGTISAKFRTPPMSQAVLKPLALPKQASSEHQTALGASGSNANNHDNHNNNNNNNNSKNNNNKNKNNSNNNNYNKNNNSSSSSKLGSGIGLAPIWLRLDSRVALTWPATKPTSHQGSESELSQQQQRQQQQRQQQQEREQEQEQQEQEPEQELPESKLASPVAVGPKPLYCLQWQPCQRPARQPGPWMKATVEIMPLTSELQASTDDKLIMACWHLAEDLALSSPHELPERIQLRLLLEDDVARAALPQHLWFSEPSEPITIGFATPADPSMALSWERKLLALLVRLHASPTPTSGPIANGQKGQDSNNNSSNNNKKNKNYNNDNNNDMLLPGNFGHGDATRWQLRFRGAGAAGGEPHTFEARAFELHELQAARASGGAVGNAAAGLSLVLPVHTLPLQGELDYAVSARLGNQFLWSDWSMFGTPLSLEVPELWCEGEGAKLSASKPVNRKVRLEWGPLYCGLGQVPVECMVSMIRLPDGRQEIQSSDEATQVCHDSEQTLAICRVTARCPPESSASGAPQIDWHEPNKLEVAIQGFQPGEHYQFLLRARHDFQRPLHKLSAAMQTEDLQTQDFSIVARSEPFQWPAQLDDEWSTLVDWSLPSPCQRALPDDGELEESSKRWQGKAVLLSWPEGCWAPPVGRLQLEAREESAQGHAVLGWKQVNWVRVRLAGHDYVAACELPFASGRFRWRRSADIGSSGTPGPCSDVCVAFLPAPGLPVAEAFCSNSSLRVRLRAPLLPQGLPQPATSFRIRYRTVGSPGIGSNDGPGNWITLNCQPLGRGSTLDVALGEADGLEPGRSYTFAAQLVTASGRRSRWSANSAPLLLELPITFGSLTAEPSDDHGSREGGLTLQAASLTSVTFSWPEFIPPAVLSPRGTAPSRRPPPALECRLDVSRRLPSQGTLEHQTSLLLEGEPGAAPPTKATVFHLWPATEYFAELSVRFARLGSRRWQSTGLTASFLTPNHEEAQNHSRILGLRARQF
ncbi:unnamed protein product, partial [Polarella glacialis]